MGKRKTPVPFPESGSLIRLYREKRGLTRDELAELAGISSHYLGYIEKGSQMAGIKILYDLAMALKVSIEEILISNKEMQKNSLKEEILHYISRMGEKELLILHELVNGVLPIFFLEEIRKEK